MRNDGCIPFAPEDSMQRQGGIAHAIHKQLSLLLGHEDVSCLFVLEIFYIIGCKFQIFVAFPIEKT